jgi:hypothetical protein
MPHVHVPASAFAPSHGSTHASTVSHEHPAQQPNWLTLRHALVAPLQSTAVAHVFAHTPEPFWSTHVEPVVQSATLVHAPPMAVELPHAATTITTTARMPYVLIAGS